MAQDLQAGKYARQLRRTFDLKGLDAIAINDHITPVILVEDFRDLAFRTYKDTKTFRATAALAGVAGQQACFALGFSTANPSPGPQAIIELQTLILNNNSAAAFDVTIGLEPAVVPAEALSIGGAPQDNRPPGPGVPSMGAVFASTLAAPGATTGPFRVLCPVGFPVILTERELPFLIPGTGTLAGGGVPIRVVCSAANAGMSTSWVWRERVVEQSEQQS